MQNGKGSRINRRDFMRFSALSVGSLAAGAIPGCASNPFLRNNRNFSGIAIVYDPQESVGETKPAQWAIQHLSQTLATRKIPTDICKYTDDVNPSYLPIHVSALAQKSKEALSIRPFSGIDTPPLLAITAQGGDALGAVYALTELADIASTTPDPIDAMLNVNIQESPANQIRSAMRMFVTDVEDKSWYYDKSFWQEYLTILVTHRFNRFNLALGLGYDAPSGMTDSYFYFAYPFLVSVPGYDVKPTNFSEAERTKNLEMLRFISDETAARGMQFQLGLWTHAYKWTSSPNVNYNIDGLNDQSQGPYCREALTILLKECPNITGVTFRIHGESGVPEGSYDFWKMVFDGCVRSGRKIEIDMHAKGMDQQTIDIALATGLPINISPKYWAEHMGLPYHQTSIRPQELPTRQTGGGLFAQSNGARSFLRYGYGDLLKEDRKYGILHRMWPGTQRVFLWGDPKFASAFSRSSGFCGSLGCEIMESLSFKGRKGSGLPGGRDGYSDLSLRAPGPDAAKYSYTYRLWGRMFYNPDTAPETWQRQLKSDYGDAAPAAETALASASRILPLFTTAHMPAAANNNYWPEMYVNMSIVDGTARAPYTETRVPSRFGTVSPLDPQLFYRVDDYVDDLLKGKVSGKYSPIEVAQWLEDLADQASRDLARAESKAANKTNSTFRRFSIDVASQSHIGQFFGQKFRAAALWAIFDRTGDRSALDAAIKLYHSARDSWVKLVEQTKDVYVKDLTYGNGWFQRGHWSDRLPAIEQDIAAMEKLATSSEAKQTDVPAQTIANAVALMQSRPQRPNISLAHTPPKSFRAGQPIAIMASAASTSASVHLFYRHTHQAEPWQSIAMNVESGRHSATIPSEYSNSPYPLEYYFEIAIADRPPTLHPGLGPNLASQPYFVLRQA